MIARPLHSVLEDAAQHEARRRNVHIGRGGIWFEVSPSYMRDSGSTAIFLCARPEPNAKYVERILDDATIERLLRSRTETLIDYLREEVRALFMAYFGPMPPPKGYKKFWRRGRMSTWRPMRAH